MHKGSASHRRILVCCIRDGHLFAERVLRAGALGFVGKGESVESLVAAVHQVLADKVYVSSEVKDRLVEGLVCRDAGGSAGVASLTDRALEVFGLLGQGLATATIAERLHLSVKTIETHREKIKRKPESGIGCAGKTRPGFRWASSQPTSATPGAVEVNRIAQDSPRSC